MGGLGGGRSWLALLKHDPLALEVLPLPLHSVPPVPTANPPPSERNPPRLLYTCELPALVVLPSPRACSSHSFSFFDRLRLSSSSPASAEDCRIRGTCCSLDAAGTQSQSLLLLPQYKVESSARWRAPSAGAAATDAAACRSGKSASEAFPSVALMASRSPPTSPVP